MNKFVEILLGLILLVVPIYIAITGALGLGFFWDSALVVLQGGIFWLLILIGALFLILGISDLRD